MGAITVCLLIICCPLVCFGRQVKIPVGMSIADFNDKVVGKFHRQLYWAVPVINGAPKFSAGLGYQLKIKQLEEENRYLVTAIADVADGDSVALQKCKSYSYYLNNDADDGTTVLNNVNETTTRYAVFWSSDVDHYTLMLRCFIKEGLPEPRTCKVEDTAISLFVPDTLDNLKWSKVLKDLEETDVEFGNERFEWFFNFNYGKSTCVDV
ncbi:uncharacterized protein LOC128236613 [Mya arenaria]|uniref:uncharacterized protein LOC128236613 n=1 Tax=Mya arenaria TaxID=6604 RepID=UPI0022E8BFF3|nr:uncharacterized protein LOC128236613 [Mya arenaria]